MSQKQLLECNRCKANGFAGQKFYFDGQDANKKWIFKNPDGTIHEHKIPEMGEEKPERIAAEKTKQEFALPTMLADLKIMIEKLASEIQGLKHEIAIMNRGGATFPTAKEVLEAQKQ